MFLYLAPCGVLKYLFRILLARFFSVMSYNIRCTYSHFKLFVQYCDVPYLATLRRYGVFSENFA